MHLILIDLTYLQNFSGVFVSILESCLEMFKVNDKLLTIYYLIFVLAAYLASFDLNFALPCNVSNEYVNYF